MVVFLTSSFIEYQEMDSYVPKPVMNANGFVDNLRPYWKDDIHFLVFSSDPDNGAMTDHVVVEIKDAFTLAGLPIGEVQSFDNRSVEAFGRDIAFEKYKEEDIPKMALAKALRWADVLFLAGGHAPTENAFMKRCHLRELIEDPEVFDGIFIGLSAGSINAAEEAYLIPELEGESVDESFVRFSEGLGLTGIHMFPHIDYYRNVVLDGKKMVDEIAREDSYKYPLYLISDGSYFIIRNGYTEFFGNGSMMENGQIYPLHPGIINEDNHRNIRPKKSLPMDYARILDAVARDYYDWVLELDLQTGNMEFFYVSGFMLENGLVPIHINSFEELITCCADHLVVEEEKEAVKDQIRISVIEEEIARKGTYVRTFHIKTASGFKAVNLRGNVIAGKKSRLLVCLTDISMILDHDWMTDDFSRSGFLTHGERLLSQAEYQSGYSMVYANIQGFKAINDLLGSASGDMVIFLEKDALIDALSPVILARLEGDHFVLITRTENITPEKMNRLCHQCYIEGSKQLHILIRCGIYHITDTSKKVQYMLDQAKLAENSISPDHGAAYAICDDRMREDYVNQRLMISELDHALEAGEFQAYYQPVVDAQTEKIVSAEALIRWKHGERGMISPGQFIPVFEREGLITKIDSFMVNQVLQFNMERLRRKEPVVPCAVNLSRVDFYDTRLLEMLKNILSQHANIQSMLKLEVTESAYAVLESNAISFLEEMKRLGLSLMLDDFGSGMSSLSTLESFAFDVIKLDMGFISQIGKSKKAEAIIKHTIGLSHDIGARVVAEGVENREQLEFLRGVACDMIQGYYFYKPMPQEEFAALL